MFFLIPHLCSNTDIPDSAGCCQGEAGRRFIAQYSVCVSVDCNTEVKDRKYSCASISSRCNAWAGEDCLFSSG